MATIKSYTDINQSKILAEILPLESADMCLTFVNNVWNPVFGKANDIYQIQKNCYEPDYTKDDYVDIDEFEPKVVPCWSLAALIDVLPLIDIEKEIWFDDTYSYRVKAYIGDGYVGDWFDNPIDACYDMIVTLNKDKLLYVQQ